MTFCVVFRDAYTKLLTSGQLTEKYATQFSTSDVDFAPVLAKICFLAHFTGQSLFWIYSTLSVPLSHLFLSFCLSWYVWICICLSEYVLVCLKCLNMSECDWICPKSFWVWLSLSEYDWVLLSLSVSPSLSFAVSVCLSLCPFVFASFVYLSPTHVSRFNLLRGLEAHRKVVWSRNMPSIRHYQCQYSHDKKNSSGSMRGQMKMEVWRSCNCTCA